MGLFSSLPLWAQYEIKLCSSAGVSLLNAALEEKEAAAQQVAAGGSKQPPPGFQEGVNRTVAMLDNAIKILELEPPGSTEIRWLQAARHERQQMFDLLSAVGGAADGR